MRRRSPSRAFQPVSLLPRSQNAHAVDLMAGDGLVAIVEHRIDQHLPGQRRPGAIPGGQRDPSRQATAGTGAGDDQARRIEAEFVGVGGRPDQAGVAVLDRGRIGVLPGPAGIRR